LTDDRYLTVIEIADLLAVAPKTVRRWLREGELVGILLGRKAGYRVKQSDLDAFLRARNTAGLAGKVESRS
jgi:excisionase family DNA binding protein